MGVIAVRCLVFSGCRNTAPEKLPRDGSGVHAACGKAENELHNGSSLRVRLHSAIGTFARMIVTLHSRQIQAFTEAVLPRFK